MHWAVPFLVLLLTATARAQDSQPLETPYTPFDFDSYRRNPLQARQTSSVSSKEDRDIQKGLLSGERGRTQDIATRASAFFQDPKEIPLRQKPASLPTPNEMTDEITVENHGETTKGPRDLLARGRVENELKLSSMSKADYELFVAQRQNSQEKSPEASGEALLRPMPTLMNSKTGGPPHAYSVSQAGIGARSEPRDNQNPFTDLIRALRLDQPVTKGNDPLPAPSARLAATPTTPLIPVSEAASPATESAAPAEDKP